MGWSRYESGPSPAILPQRHVLVPEVLILVLHGRILLACDLDFPTSDPLEKVLDALPPAIGSKVLNDPLLRGKVDAALEDFRLFDNVVICLPGTIPGAGVEVRKLERPVGLVGSGVVVGYCYPVSMHARRKGIVSR